MDVEVGLLCTVVDPDLITRWQPKFFLQLRGGAKILGPSGF